MFKKLLLTVAIVTTSLMAQSDSTLKIMPQKSVEQSSTISWAKGYEEAHAEALKFGKPMFFAVSNKNCPPCRMLKKNTFSDKRVIAELNKNFATSIAYLNFKDPSNDDYVPRELSVRATPTLWFIIPAKNIIFSPIKGYVDANMFLDMMKQVQEKANEKEVK